MCISFYTLLLHLLNQGACVARRMIHGTHPGLAAIPCIVLCHCFLLSRPQECFMASSSVTRSYFPEIYGRWPDPQRLFSQTGQCREIHHRSLSPDIWGWIRSSANKARKPQHPWTTLTPPSWTQSWTGKGSLVWV